MPAVLDDIDLDILRHMQDNARISNADLARAVSLSPSSVLQRVRRLEELGVLTGYAALIDPQRVGLGLTVLCQISLELHQDRPIETFRKAVREIPEVLECHHVSGDFDFLLKIVAADMRRYEELIRKRISRIPGVGKIQSHFVLATTKHTVRLPIEDDAGQA